MSAVHALEHRQLLADRFVACSTPVSPVVLRLANGAARSLPVAALAELVGADSELSLRVMALANSAFYSRQYQVDTLRGALVVLGSQTLHTLASGLLARGCHLDDRPAALALQQCSRTVGIGARMLAELHRQCEPNTAFIAGLVHNIGAVALLRFDEPPLAPAEHAALGARIADRLGLTQDLVDAIAWHHHWQTGHDALVTTVFVASRLAQEPDAEDDPYAEALARLGLVPDDLDVLRTGLPQQVASLGQVLAHADGER